MDIFKQNAGALQGVKVLQFESPLCNYTGKLFAELGADVILIEHPNKRESQNALSNSAPETCSENTIKRSYFNTSKRSITLDIDSSDGLRLFKRLAMSSHMVIESLEPGFLKKRGVDYLSLCAENPQLVMVSITPFGQDGPYANYMYEDITLLALGGLLSLGGYAETEPIAAWGEQGYLAGSQFGAVAAMIALLEAEATGEGQHVDVAVQECIVMALENSVQFYELEGTIRKRYGGQQREAGSGIFPCKDGMVLLLAGGIGATQFWGSFCDWLIAEGVVDAEQLQGEHWTIEYRRTSEAKSLFEKIFVSHSSKYTKAQLYAAAQARRIPLCPLNSIDDVLKNKQLIARDFFIDSYKSKETPIKIPGAPYRLSKTPWQSKSVAPAPGQHNAEIYSEAGYKASEIESFLVKGVI